MTVDQRVRYSIEQHLLPRSLYSNGPSVILKYLEHQGAVIYEFYKQAESVCNGYICPYVPEDFNIQCHKYIAQGIAYLVVRIQMPDPAGSLQSRAVYMCYGNYGIGDLYFTSELSETGEFILSVQCENGSRINLCPAPLDESDETSMVASLFKDFRICQIPHVVKHCV